MNDTSKNFRDVYIVDGYRTPFLKAKGKPGPFTASDLAVYAGRDLLAHSSFNPEDVDEVILGCVIPGVDEANIARIVALRLGCGNKVPGWTVQRNCASGMQSIDNAYQNIATGRSDLVLVGGTESMSHAPVLFSETMVNWLASWQKAHSPVAKLKMLTSLRAKHFIPLLALLRGLTDPIVGLSMGQTAENLAYRFHITREQMDEFAYRSHQRLAEAVDKNHYPELITVYDKDGNYYDADNGLRRDTSMEKLSSLKPFFDKIFGMVTAGNSSQVTDGAAMLTLASEIAVKRYNLPVLGRIIDSQWAAVDPVEMGLGPAHATVELLQRQGMNFDDIDYMEMNEAFAAQVLACVEAWKNKQYCQEHFGLNNAFGELPLDKLNIDGGAIAIGHPLGASGARIILHLLQILKRKQAKRGIANICIGGGQGGAMLIETVS